MTTHFVRRVWRRTASFLLITGAMCAAHGAIAATEPTGDYPSRPVTIVVPFPPGGSPDQLARILAQCLAARWQQPVIVDNRPGAGGNIATGQVARAKADGYTLLMGTDGPLAINPAVYPKIPYDAKRDFAPIAQAATVDFVLVSATHLPVEDLQQFLTFARAQREPLAYGSSGVGSQHHLGMEVFRSQTHIAIRHVPYRGVAQALADLMGNHVSIMFAALPSAAPLVRSRKVRALAVTGTSRSPLAPNVPTMAEAGVKGFELKAWFGLVGPAALSKSLVMKINADVRSALTSEEVRASLATNGFSVVTGEPEDFARFIDAEQRRWSQIAKSNGIRAD